MSERAQRTWASHVSCVSPASRPDAGLSPPCTPLTVYFRNTRCSPATHTSMLHYVTTDTSKQGCATRHTSNDNPTPRPRYAVPSAHLHLSIPTRSSRVDSAALCSAFGAPCRGRSYGAAAPGNAAQRQVAAMADHFAAAAVAGPRQQVLAVPPRHRARRRYFIVFTHLADVTFG